MILRKLAILAALALVVALAAPLQAAETVHLYLKISGADVNGESTQTSLGREGSIECVYYEHSIGSTTQNVAAGRAAGKGEPQYNPIVIRKRIDKSSPLLLKAVAQGQPVEGIFKFFRPNPTGDGTTEQFYTVQFQGGRVDSVKQYVPDTIEPASSTMPPIEEVTFSYSSVTFTYTSTGSTTKTRS
ncbi:MAG: type VI secretion system tube protein Hcp [Armatimonadetes bacterium]|nr:type VI secretion system tube protein Hcp [Armatimonadota bacterium]